MIWARRLAGGSQRQPEGQGDGVARVRRPPRGGRSGLHLARRPGPAGQPARRVRRGLTPPPLHGLDAGVGAQRGGDVGQVPSVVDVHVHVHVEKIGLAVVHAQLDDIAAGLADDRCRPGPARRVNCGWWRSAWRGRWSCARPLASTAGRARLPRGPRTLPASRSRWCGR